MKNILPVNSPSAPAIAKVENTEEFSTEALTEEIVLYDECGDTQWDKVLMQHDLGDQLSKDIKK